MPALFDDVAWMQLAPRLQQVPEVADCLRPAPLMGSCSGPKSMTASADMLHDEVGMSHNEVGMRHAEGDLPNTR
jgi:hypothetical protein